MLYHTMVAVHVTAVCLVVGTLFVQSLAVVFRFRMTEDAQIAGAQWIQHRIYKFIYYPIPGDCRGNGSIPGNDHRSLQQWALVTLQTGWPVTADCFRIPEWNADSQT